MGLVDDASVVGELPRAKEHIFLKEKAEWWNVPENDGMARHEALDRPFQNRLDEWIAKGCPQRPDGA